MLLVTGITGLTGRFLFGEFKRQRRVGDLRCLIRSSSDLSWMGDVIPDFCCGDVSDIKDLARCMEGVEGIIHLVNIRHSPQVIEACKQTGVKRVIFVNTTGMYSKYQAYSGLYRQLEERILASGLEYTIIRPTMIYGNHLDKNIHKLVKLMKRLPVFPVIGDGSSLMQPIYAEDLAKVIYHAFESEKAIGNDYNVAGREPVSYMELLKEIANALGRKPLFFQVPYSFALLAGRLGDFIPNGLVNLERIQRLSEDKAFDYSKARDELGFNPMPFREGVMFEVKSLKKVGLI